MKVWTIANQKGGVGKTTLGLNLAIAASQQDQVLLIDLDPTESAERWHALRQKHGGPKDFPSIAAGPYQRLHNMLKAAKSGGADLVIIDCPPKIGAAITATFAVADRVLIPLQPGTLEFQALEDTVGLMNLGKVRSKVTIILNEIHSGKQGEAEIKECERAAQRFKLPVLEQRLSSNPAYRTSLATGKGVTEFEPNGKAAKEIRAILRALS